MSRLDVIEELQEFLATSQQNRLMRLSFPKGDGPDALMVVSSLDAEEALSRDFKFEVEILSDDPRIELKNVLGKLVCIELIRSDGSPRYFTGHVFEFTHTGTDAGFARYRMELGPWLRYLEQSLHSTIFHYKTLAEQTGLVFDAYPGVKNWSLRLMGEDPQMTDAIQFNESDYRYLHRRWEELGWHYWYEHTAEGHQLIISDDSPGCEPVEGDVEILYQTETGAMDADVISRLTPTRQVASTEVALASFDFKQPRPKFEGVPTLNNQGEAVPTLEVYEYTGTYGFKDSADGDRMSRQRMEEIEAKAKGFDGQGNNPYLQLRRWFQLANVYGTEELEKEDDLQFMVTAIRHQASNNYEQRGQGATYHNAFECLRKKIPWRPGRNYNSEITRILHPQTAIVVGPEGQELHTDKYGRVRVQFHWDREGQYDERSSAWVRVSSNWAGDNYGFMALPRIGQEVIVSFLDGNPDRPIITGRVYNEEQMPPWELNGQHALMGFKSKELFSAGFNQLILDDTAEQIQVQLSSTHQTSQLSLGYITRIPGTVGRKEHRGEGFELRTDGWGAIRAGAGLFVSTDMRSGAQSTQRDMSEAMQQLEEARSMLEGMSKAAEKARALAAACNRQKAMLQQRIDDLKQAVILASAPAGIAMTTPTDLQYSSGESTFVVAGARFDTTVMKHYTLAVREGISMFSQTNGVKQIAGKGKIERLVLDDNDETSAEKDIKISSADGEIVVSAKKQLLVACGGGYIRLSGGNIELGCPGAIVHKTSSFGHTGPANKNINVKLPTTDTYDPARQNHTLLSK